MRTGIAGLLATIVVAAALGAAGVSQALPVVGAPAAEPVLMSKTEFRDRMVAYLRERFPAITVVVESETDLRVQGAPSGEQRMFLGNAYRLYRNDPESLDAILSRFSSMAMGSGEDALQVADLRAMIRPIDFLEQVKAMMLQDGKPYPVEEQPVSRPFAADLILLIAQDHPETFSYPKRVEVMAVVADEDEAWRRAVANLPAAVGEVVVEDLEEGILVVSSEGSLTPSLLLVEDTWRHRDLRRIKTPVVLLGSREIMLVVDAGNPRGVAAMRTLASHLAKDPDSGLLSPALLIKRGDGWEVLPD